MLLPKQNEFGHKMIGEDMVKQYYHGTCTPGISVLEARSLLHDTKEKVVYLTDSIPYALFYIWDAVHNDCNAKHVTGWMKDGIAYYEEQFPDQLKTFYQGISGYLYGISDNESIQSVGNRTNMFYCLGNVAVAETIHIPDVYDEMLKYELEGKLVVLRYNEQSPQRQNELIDLMARGIVRHAFYADNTQMKEFMKRNFIKAWERALLIKNSF